MKDINCIIYTPFPVVITHAVREHAAGIYMVNKCNIWHKYPEYKCDYHRY